MATLTIATYTPQRVHLVLDNPTALNVGKVMRADVNGTRTLRTQTGQLPSTGGSLDFYDYEAALSGNITYTAYSVANAVIATATLEIGGTALDGLTFRGPWPVARTNLISNPSFETDTTGWSP